MFMNLIIEAKQRKLISNCESSEAKRTCLIVKLLSSKLSEHVYIEKFRYQSEANALNSLKINFEAKNLIMEAKRRKLILNCESRETK